jgi:hypothetical protein
MGRKRVLNAEEKTQKKKEILEVFIGRSHGMSFILLFLNISGVRDQLPKAMIASPNWKLAGHWRT